VGPWVSLDKYGEDKVSCIHWGLNPTVSHYTNYAILAPPKPNKVQMNHKSLLCVFIFWPASS